MVAHPDDVKLLEEAGVLRVAESTDINSSYPEDADGLNMLRRLYVPKEVQDPVTKTTVKVVEPLNCARPIEHLVVVRVVLRNYGFKDDDKNKDTQGDAARSTSQGKLLVKAKSLPVELAFAVPSPMDLYKLVWDIVPDGLKRKIADWAAKNMEGPIADEINDFVKQILRTLPLPIPGIFVNAAANMIIPPLVRVIIGQLTTVAGGSRPAVEFHQSNAEKPIMGPTVSALADTPSLHRALVTHDNEILRRAGLPGAELARRAALLELGNEDQNNLAGGSSDDNSSGHSSSSDHPCLGQPDNHDAKAAALQFYTDNATNGCKPMHLSQIVAAQIRVNPASDGKPSELGQAVSGELTDEQKTKIKLWARASDRASIANEIYAPLKAVLAKTPYLVPDPILSAFTTMKVPEVTEWIMDPLSTG